MKATVGGFPPIFTPGSKPEKSIALEVYPFLAFLYRFLALAGE